MEAETVSIYLMGKKYEVPAEQTVIGAMEAVGIQHKKGIGCREGFCGACAIVYRKKGDYKLYTGLGCQTVVEEGMYVAQIPFVPADKPTYDLTQLTPSVAVFQQLYPEVFRCVSCNTCTKACPQNINVMEYINCVERGDLAKAADISFNCIRCGLCGLRCPAEIAQFNVGYLAQRLYARYLSPKPEYLAKRLAEIKDGKYDSEIEAMMKMNQEELKKKYYARDIEPGEKA